MIRTRPYLHVVLHQPEIPANAGNIARLCGAAELRLHLIHPLGFKVDDKHLKRAGLDYWSEIDLHHHSSFEAFLESKEEGQVIAFSSHASQDYPEAKVQRGDYLLFAGGEKIKRVDAEDAVNELAEIAGKIINNWILSKKS